MIKFWFFALIRVIRGFFSFGRGFFSYLLEYW